MANISESDIREAKERVRRMQRRASAYIDPQEKEEKKETQQETEKTAPPLQMPEIPAPCASEEQTEDEDSSFIILMLILLLSHEGADNALILALLYLLF